MYDYYASVFDALGVTIGWDYVFYGFAIKHIFLW